MSNELTVIQRASVALGAAEHEKKLVALAKQSVEIVAITNPASYQQLHGARMVLKNERVALEKLGKAARDDATKFSKAVIAEEARLIQIIEPEERRLEAIQTAHDERAAREKAERERAEAERIARIQAAIEEIKSADFLMTITDEAALIAVSLENAKAIVIDERFQEFSSLAELAKVQAVTKLTKLHAGALEYEAEQEQARKEREELARMRAAEEQRQREAAEKEAAEIRRRAEEEAKAKAAIETQERASREKIEAEERAARLKREEEDREAQEAREAEEKRLKAEQDRLAEERRVLEEQQRAQRAADEAAARKVVAEQAERERLARLKQERLDAGKRALLETEDLIRALRGRLGVLKPYAGIAKAIDRYLAKANAAAQQPKAA